MLFEKKSFEEIKESLIYIFKLIDLIFWIVLGLQKNQAESTENSHTPLDCLPVSLNT